MVNRYRNGYLTGSSRVGISAGASYPGNTAGQPGNSRFADDGAQQLEYPVGTVLYKSRSGGYISEIRVSASGDRVAFFDHQANGDDRGVVMAVDTAGKATTLTTEFTALEGLAWEQSEQSVPFAGSKLGGMYQVHRAGLRVAERLVLPSPGNLTLHDVAADGRWLVTRDDAPVRITVRPPGSSRLKDLSWLDNSLNVLISGDGEMIAFTDQSILPGLLHCVMIRKTDGSPVVRLGDGGAVALADLRCFFGCGGPQPSIPPNLYVVAA